MGRRRKFSEDVIIDEAIHLFWKQGFDDTTVDEVIERASVSKSSFYSAFKSKHDLLDRALHRYGETWMLGVVAPLGRSDASRSDIEQTCQQLIERYSGPEASRGCLALNCAVDAAPSDPRIVETVADMRFGFESAIRTAIERGQQDGTVTSQESSESLARLLMSSMTGLIVMGKFNPSREVLEDVARLSLRVLD